MTSSPPHLKKPGPPKPLPPVFNAAQLQRLRLAVGHRLGAVLPGLEEGVRKCDPKRALVDVPIVRHRADAAAVCRALPKKQAEAAYLLTSEIAALSQSLNLFLPYLKDAYLAGELPFNSMADPVSREKPEVRWQRQEERIASALITMQALRGAVEQWGQHKRSQAKNRPGRPPKPPKLELAGWVGYVLASAGVKLTTGRNGQWARAARVVYQVAGLPVPEAGFDRRILASSLEFLLQYIPETTKRNSAQKTLRRSRVDFRPVKIG